MLRSLVPLSLLFAAPASAAEPLPYGPCERVAFEPPRVELAVDDPAPRYDDSRSASELAGLAGAHADTRQVVLGVTRAEVVAGFSLGLLYAELPDGTVCVAPERVQADIGHAELTVLLDRRFVAGSCAYDTTRAHEDEHVAINRAALRRHAEAFETALTEAVGDWGARRMESAAAAEAALTGVLDRVLRDVLDSVTADAAARNAAIDTPAAYEALRGRCDDWP